MLYQQNLSFLCEIFKKNHIGAAIFSRNELLRAPIDEFSDDLFYARRLLRLELPRFRERTLYQLTDTFSFSYRFLILPETEPSSLLAIGPYRTGTLSEQERLEMGEQNAISPQKQRYFSEYYDSIPLLPNDSPLWTMLHTFCERLWNSPSFEIQSIQPNPLDTSPPSSPLPFSFSDNDTLVNMKTMERRYAFENELIRAVEQGQMHMEERLLSSFSNHLFEQRTPDLLRNAKNYGIIMNTLLRKAAERGGVHPLHIDRISSLFAIKIESLASLQQNHALMCEMFRTYCQLVREHATHDLPALIQQTIILIDSDLSADLAPSLLAKQQDVSLGHLSQCFKKATGETISEYTRRRRMEHAAHLLRTTNLQIQTVALHCGILDLQYFSKIFKRHFQVSPSQYRRSYQKEGQIK